MKVFLAIVAVLFSLAPANVEARIIRGQTPAPPVEKSVQNIEKNSFLGGNGVDWLRGGGWRFLTSGNYADAVKLDDDGYMTAAPTVTTDFLMDIPNAPPTAGATYKLVVDAGITFKFTGKFSFSNCVAVNITVSGCTGFNATITKTNPAAGSLTFTYGSASPFVLAAEPDGVFARAPGARMALYRLDLESRYQQNIYASPEFESLLRGTKASWLRPMGAVQVGAAAANYETLWRNRIKATNLSWAQKIPAGALPQAGGSCGAAKICGTSNVYTADAAPDVGGSVWNDGDVIVGYFESTNTTTTPTFAIASRPPLPIFNDQGFPLTVGAITTTNFSTLIYNATLGGLLYGSGTPPTSIPIEARVQYANYFNMHLWDTFPYMALDSYITTQIQYAYDNLNPWLKYGPEYYNEMWNPAFKQNQWAIKMMYAMGFQLGGGGSFQYTGLRNRQIAGIAASIFGFSGLRSGRLWPVSAYQIGAGNNNALSAQLNGVRLVNNYQTQSTVSFTVGTPCQIVWPFNGWGSSKVQISITSTGTLPTGITSGQLYYVVNNTDNNSSSSPFNLSATENGAPIACSGTPTGTATATYINTIYNTMVGQDYSTKPNRPRDYAMITAGAPYIGGQNMCNVADGGCGAATFPNNTIPTTTAAFWQSAISNWESGNSSAAFAAMDDDYRKGRIVGTIQTVTASGTTFTTPIAHGFSAGQGVAFEVTGGTMYSGIAPLVVYAINTVPTTTTFTLQAYIGGLQSGAAINAGTAGTGTVTVGLARYNNLINLASVWLSYSQSIANTVNSDRPAGYDPVYNAQYEGSFEMQPLNSTQCSSLGIVATDCPGSSTAMVTAFKYDERAKQLQIDYWNCAIGLHAGCPTLYGQAPNSVMPSSLVLYGNNVWATSPSLTGTPYKTYEGIATFNTNWLLRRDINPASNDNDPMWLEKAA